MKRFILIFPFILFFCSSDPHLILANQGVGSYHLGDIIEYSPAHHLNNYGFYDKDGLRIIFLTSVTTPSDMIHSILVLSPEYYTSENIRVGSSRRDVINKYPDCRPWIIDHFKGDSEMYESYFFENYDSLVSDDLLFILKDNSVIGIQMFK